MRGTEKETQGRQRRHVLRVCRVSLGSRGGIVEAGRKGEYMFEPRRRLRAGLEQNKKQGA